jgi:hypothetical protein
MVKHAGAGQDFFKEIAMSDFLKYFMSNAGSEATTELSKQLGIKKNVAAQIVPQVVPMILSGLKKQKDDHGGEARVDKILNKYGSVDVLQNIAGLFSSKAEEKKPDPGLGGLLGDAGIQATQLLSKNFKLDASSAQKIIPMLAPLVLGALLKKRDNDGAGSSGIAGLLDADGDGSILDDVAGFLGGGSTKNALGSLLGGFFGK